MLSYEIAIPLLTGLAVILIGGAFLMLARVKRSPLEARLREIGGGTVSIGERSGPDPLAGVLGRVGRTVAPKQSNSLKQSLASAGFHDAAAPTVFIGTKIVLLCIGLIIFGFLVMYLDITPTNRMLIAGSASILLFFIPNVYVSQARQRRHADVQSHLPDAIDLLEISVSAGMGIDQAWNSVANEVRSVSRTLADEMALNNLEVQLGAPRAIAMRHMADRTGSRDLGSLVAILVQSEKFGTSIAEALRTFADSMREARSMRAQEHAEKMAVKLIFPMVIFIFPAVVIVMAGPGFMSLAQALKGPR